MVDKSLEPLSNFNADMIVNAELKILYAQYAPLFDQFKKTRTENNTLNTVLNKMEGRLLQGGESAEKVKESLDLIAAVLKQRLTEIEAETASDTRLTQTRLNPEQSLIYLRIFGYSKEIVPGLYEIAQMEFPQRPTFLAAAQHRLAEGSVPSFFIDPGMNTFFPEMSPLLKNTALFLPSADGLTKKIDLSDTELDTKTS